MKKLMSILYFLLGLILVLFFAVYAVLFPKRAKELIELNNLNQFLKDQEKKNSNNTGVLH